MNEVHLKEKDWRNDEVGARGSQGKLSGWAGGGLAWILRGRTQLEEKGL